MENRDGKQGWKTEVENRDGKQGWKTGVENRDGKQLRKTGMVNSEFPFKKKLVRFKTLPCKPVADQR